MLPIRIHRQDVIVSGESWRLYREANPSGSFQEFWTSCCQYFFLHSFPLGWFFLAHDKFAIANVDASDPPAIVKMEPPSPLASDDGFAYACDVAEGRGSKPGHVIELPF